MTAEDADKAFKRAAGEARGAGRSWKGGTKANGHARHDDGEAPDWPLLSYGGELSVQPLPYLVKGLINRGAFSCWYGKPKSGKSFVVLDLALHIAAGKPWRGRRVRQGQVLYLALEGGPGFVNRLAAARAKFGPDPLPFHALTVPLNLLNGSADELRAFLQARAQDLGQFDLIVVDTLSRASAGGNENAPEVMTQLVGMLDEIRAQTGAHVLAIHHVPKSGEGMRGHGSLLGAVDVAVEIADRTVRVAEARDTPDGDAWAFDLEPVQLGIDEDGDPITSCIIRESDREPEPRTTSHEPRARPLGPVEQVTLDALKAALVDEGKPAADAGALARDIPPRAVVVTREAVDRAALRYLPGDKEAWRTRSDIKRALQRLAGKRVVRHVADWFWLPAEEDAA